MLDFTKYTLGKSYQEFVDNCTSLTSLFNEWLDLCNTMEDAELLRLGLWQAELEMRLNYAKLELQEQQDIVELFKADVIEEHNLQAYPKAVINKIFDISGIDEMNFEEVYDNFLVHLEIVDLVLEYAEIDYHY